MKNKLRTRRTLKHIFGGLDHNEMMNKIQRSDIMSEQERDKITLDIVNVLPLIKSTTPQLDKSTTTKGAIVAGANIANTALNGNATNMVGNGLLGAAGISAMIPGVGWGVSAGLAAAGLLANGFTNTVNDAKVNAVNSLIDAINNQTIGANESEILNANNNMLSANIGSVEDWGTAGFLSSGSARKDAMNNAIALQANAKQGFVGRINLAATSYDLAKTEALAYNVVAFGGNIETHGSDFPTGLTHIDKGGTHENSPYEGVPMGLDNEGTPNLVEEGETIYNDYVFSNRLIVPEYKKPSNGDKFLLFEKVLNKYKGKTYSDAAKKAEKDSGVDERPNDDIAKRGFESVLEILALSLELERDILNYPDKAEEIRQYSPEEYQSIKQLQELEALMMLLQLAMGLLLELLMQMLQLAGIDPLLFALMSPELLLQIIALLLQQMLGLLMSPEEQLAMLLLAMLGLQMSSELAMQLQAMAQLEVLPLMSLGGNIHAEGGNIELSNEQPTVNELALEQANTSGTEEAPLEPMTEWELGTPAEDMSTKELNAMVDKLYNYAKENKDRELLKRARKARRGSRDDKEEFVDDAREDILMLMEEQQQLLLEIEAQLALEQLVIEQLQLAEMLSALADAGLELNAQDGGYLLFAEGGNLTTSNMDTLPAQQPQEVIDDDTAIAVILLLASSKNPKNQLMALLLYLMLSTLEGNLMAKQYIILLLLQSNNNAFAYGGDTKNAENIIDYIMHLGKWQAGKYFNRLNAIKVAQGLINSNKINIHDIIGILYNIGHESGFNPNAKNKRSTARGLVQWLLNRHPKNWDIDSLILHIINEVTNSKGTYYLGEGHSSEEDAINWATDIYEAPEKWVRKARKKAYKKMAKLWKPETMLTINTTANTNINTLLILETPNTSSYVIDKKTNKPLEVENEKGEKVKIVNYNLNGTLIGEDGKLYEANIQEETPLNELIITGRNKSKDTKELIENSPAAAILVDNNGRLTFPSIEPTELILEKIKLDALVINNIQNLIYEKELAEHRTLTSQEKLEIIDTVTQENNIKLLKQENLEIDNLIDIAKEAAKKESTPEGIKERRRNNYKKEKERKILEKTIVKLKKALGKKDEQFIKNLERQGYTVEEYVKWLNTKYPEQNIDSIQENEAIRNLFITSYNKDLEDAKNSYLTEDIIKNKPRDQLIKIAQALGLDISKYKDSKGDVVLDILDIANNPDNTLNLTLGQLTEKLQGADPLKIGDTYAYADDNYLNNLWKRDYNTWGYYDNDGKFVDVNAPTGNEGSKGNSPITFVGVGDWFTGNDDAAKEYELSDNYLDYYKDFTLDILNGDESALQRLYTMGEQSKGSNGENRYFRPAKLNNEPLKDRLRNNAVNRNIDQWDKEKTKLAFANPNNRVTSNTYKNLPLLYLAMLDAQLKGAGVIKLNHLLAKRYLDVFLFDDDQGHYLDVGDRTLDDLKKYYDISEPVNSDVDGRNIYTLSRKKDITFSPITDAQEEEKEAEELNKNQAPPFPRIPSGQNYIGAGLLAAGLLHNIVNKPDYSNADALINAATEAGKYRPINFKPIGNYVPLLTYDINYVNNRALDANAAAIRLLENSVNGNVGALMAGLLALNNNYNIGIGNNYRLALEYNDLNRIKTSEFNKDTDKFNSEGFLKADMANLDALMKSRSLNLEGIAKGYAMRQAIEDERAKAINAGLTGLASSINNAINTKWQNDMLAWALLTNPYVIGQLAKHKKDGGNLFTNNIGLS